MTDMQSSLCSRDSEVMMSGTIMIDDKCVYFSQDGKKVLRNVRNQIFIVEVSQFLMDW